jgi:hypothetical protein
MATRAEELADTLVGLNERQAFACKVLVENVAQDRSRDRNFPDDGRSHFGQDRELSI